MKLLKIGTLFVGITILYRMLRFLESFGLGGGVDSMGVQDILLLAGVQLVAIACIHGYIIANFTLDNPFVQTIRQVSIFFVAISVGRVMVAILYLTSVVGFSLEIIIGLSLLIPLALLLLSDPPRPEDRQIQLTMGGIMGFVAFLTFFSAIIYRLIAVDFIENSLLYRMIVTIFQLVPDLLHLPLVYILSHYTFLNEEKDQQEMPYITPEVS